MVQEKGLGALVGEVGYIDNFRVTRPVGAGDEFIDGRDTFTVVIDETRSGLHFEILRFRDSRTCRPRCWIAPHLSADPLHRFSISAARGELHLHQVPLPALLRQPAALS